MHIHNHTTLHRNHLRSLHTLYTRHLHLHHNLPPKLPSLGTSGRPPPPDSPKALEFISSFNSRRTDTPSNSSFSNTSAAPPPVSTPSEVPKATRKPQKQKAPLGALPSRTVEGQGDLTGSYKKGHL